MSGTNIKKNFILSLASELSGKVEIEPRPSETELKPRSKLIKKVSDSCKKPLCGSLITRSSSHYIRNLSDLVAAVRAPPIARRQSRAAAAPPPPPASRSATASARHRGRSHRRQRPFPPCAPALPCDSLGSRRRGGALRDPLICGSGFSGGECKAKITHALIKDIVAKALNDMGYECPEKDLNKPRALAPVDPTLLQEEQRRASSLSDNESTSSDSTVVGSESESESAQSVKSDKIPKDGTSFTLVEGKNRKAVRKATKKAKVSRDSPAIGMDLDAYSAAATTVSPPTIPDTQNPVSAPTQAVTANSSPRSGAKPATPPRSKLPHFLAQRRKFPQSIRGLHPSADKLQSRSHCRRRHKIFCPDVETFRSLNKYLVDSKVQFHTYALEEERKIKAVIRGIPTDFPVKEIQTDLRAQGFPVHSVHRLCRRDGSPLWLVLAVLPRTEEARNIFTNLNRVCGLSGIRVEAPHKKGGARQCHRCQLYGHAAANCHADPRCVKCLVSHWTRECPLTRESGEKPSCVNCGQQHTANYGGCPKAPKFNPQNRPNPNRPKSRPIAPPRDLNNFPDLPGNKPSPPAAPSRPATTSSNPWVKSKPTLPPRAAPGPSGEAVRRAPPVSPPTSATAGTSSFGEDVQTVMAVLRAVSSSEISEFARDIRACRSVDEKLLVLVRYHHLMVSRSLHCCPIDILLELAMTGHHLVMVSVYLPSPQPLHRRDLRAFLGGCRHPLWTVVEKCEREVSASSDRRKFPPDILELIRAKNKGLRRASAYPTPEYRSRARALQREVKARVQEFRNDGWSDLMEEMSRLTKRFGKSPKRSKRRGILLYPRLKDRTVPLPSTTRR
ncbi:Nucleic-acid-binding protein from transposon X-element [Eumeta japonica]|uniref:Nucleic-acid-binding protein from transposon X-element n=1 Tax=Eumeta variegata TaxID=151549 RepID=A0A4C2AGX8_EUMVA|nr:Nucleic-acid-binding protein from transposon X-element [Eumeta japonica]